MTIASIPKVDDEYDLETLQDMMISLKQQYPEQDAASVLMERMIPYDYLIQVMDVVRSVEVAVEGGEEEEFELYALFKQGSTGDVTGDRPGLLDFVGGAKYDAWARLAGTSREEAMQRYIDKVAALRGD